MWAAEAGARAIGHELTAGRGRKARRKRRRRRRRRRLGSLDRGARRVGGAGHGEDGEGGGVSVSVSVRYTAQLSEE